MRVLRVLLATREEEAVAQGVFLRVGVPDGEVVTVSVTFTENTYRNPQ